MSERVELTSGLKDVEDVEVDPFKATAELIPEVEASSRLGRGREGWDESGNRVPAAPFSGMFPQPHDDPPCLREEQENSSGACTTGLCLELEHRESPVGRLSWVLAQPAGESTSRGECLACPEPIS